jgi:hypothetical protein
MAETRLSQDIIQQDVSSFKGFKTIPDYTTSRSDATAEVIEAAYQDMLDKQQQEKAAALAAKDATAAARKAERHFHVTVRAMKEVVKGQYGIDGREANAVGLKRRSEYNTPKRKPKG